jgi:hypothetical protein
MTSTARALLTALLTTAAAVGMSADQSKPPLSRVMREKLQHSQAILAAVVTSDWAALDRESRQLALVSKDPAWVTALTDPAYLRQSDAFGAAVQKLIETSSKRDLEAAGEAEVALTRSCVSCHIHMARNRVARSDLQ